MSDIPAFPVSFKWGRELSQYNGMTLRDYFAGQALAGNLEQGIEDNMHYSWWHDPTKIAKRAYAIADAMMKARVA